MIKLILKSGKDEAVKRFHPWIFSGAIKKMSAVPDEGEIVSVFSNKDEFLGKGHYSGGSIAVRIISFEDINFNFDFWFNALHKAYKFREKIGLTDNNESNVYRLLHAEGDGYLDLLLIIIMVML